MREYPATHAIDRRLPMNRAELSLSRRKPFSSRILA
jgi:hypothetical protein